MPKFFVFQNQMVGNEVHILGQDARHIQAVLRMQAGDSLIVCDGQGTDYRCVIQQIDKSAVIAEVVQAAQNLSEPEIQVTLFQAMPKADKMEYLIQKSVELGVHQIVPVKTERTIVKSAENKIDRWQKIAESAAKQCGRGRIPSIQSKISFLEACQFAQRLDHCFLLYEQEKSNSLKKALKNLEVKSLGFIIGPEGGFSPEEAETAAAYSIDCITLGNRILRSETAGLYVLSVAMFQLDGGI